MAQTLDEKQLALQQPQAASQATPAAVANTDAAAPATPAAPEAPQLYSGMKGLTDGTAQKLQQYATSTYTPGQSVVNAQTYLQGILDQKPGEYKSKYQSQLDSLYDQIMNRQKFSYDLNGDALYNQYRDQYMRGGKQAMQDTMGQAAALTGGYGSSYATTAGNQAYQQYLAGLNDKVPELYRMALDQYNAEGDRMQNQFSMARQLEDTDYGRYRDTVSDWNNDYSRANTEYWNQYNADYDQYNADRNYYMQLAQQEQNSWQAERDYAYSFAMSMLNNGLWPDASWLELAGIPEADARQIYNKNQPVVYSGGGSSKSSGGGNTNPVKPTTVSKPLQVNIAAKQADKLNLQNMLNLKRNANASSTGAR